MSIRIPNNSTVSSESHQSTEKRHYVSWVEGWCRERVCRPIPRTRRIPGVFLHLTQSRQLRQRPLPLQVFDRGNGHICSRAVGFGLDTPVSGALDFHRAEFLEYQFTQPEL